LHVQIPSHRRGLATGLGRPGRRDPVRQLRRRPRLPRPPGRPEQGAQRRLEQPLHHVPEQLRRAAERAAAALQRQEQHPDDRADLRGSRRPSSASRGRTQGPTRCDTLVTCLRGSTGRLSRHLSRTRSICHACGVPSEARLLGTAATNAMHTYTHSIRTAPCPQGRAPSRRSPAAAWPQ